MTTQLQPQWIVGFVDGEGCFHIGITRNQKNPELKKVQQILPEFTVVQHQSDIQILYALKAYFGCGVVRKNNGDRMCYRVRGRAHLRDIILPFFEKHKLKTKKRVQFEKFRDVVLLMCKDEHLLPEGVEKIEKIRLSLSKLLSSKDPSNSLTPLPLLPSKGKRLEGVGGSGEVPSNLFKGRGEGEEDPV